MESGTVEERPATTRRGVPRAARRRVPRSRGALSGFLLILLGIWAGLIPFVGPYFNYEFGSDQTWVITWDRVWLNVLPAAALFFGGLILLGSRSRISGAFGAWLAIAGGIWFAIGPAMSLLWDASLGPAAPVGLPIGSNGVQVLEYIGFFYGVAAVGTALAAFALGRLSIVGVRDVEYATAGAPAQPAATTANTSAGRPAPRTGDGADGEEPAGQPPRRGRLRRLLSRG
jgi:hypothetical protein